MTINDHGVGASLNRREGEGGSERPRMRLYRRTLLPLNKLNLLNSGGVVEALDGAISARVRVMMAHSIRRKTKPAVR